MISGLTGLLAIFSSMVSNLRCIRVCTEHRLIVVGQRQQALRRAGDLGTEIMVRCVGKVAVEVGVLENIDCGHERIARPRGVEGENTAGIQPFFYDPEEILRKQIRTVSTPIPGRVHHDEVIAMVGGS